MNPGIPRKKCLFLFTELAGYIVACMKKLAETQHVEVHVLRWPVNAVAPFKFSLEGEHLFFYERKDYNNQQLLDLVIQLHPDVILCSGWIDKGYNAVCKHFFGKVNTVLGLDNPWRNTLKQNIASVAGPHWLRKYFSHCWVPGASQKKYARKLGFSDAVIREGAYSCDFDIFHQQYLQNLPAKEKKFPKKIIYVGRYTKLKGTKELWEAFVEFQRQQPNEWELWCLGKGELESGFPQHDKIKNVGFVQPSDMHNYISSCGVFILPSHYEHWGVVVHEFAAAGFPLICTTSTGAASVFLQNGHNGFAIPPYDVTAMVEVFRKINTMPETDLLRMGARSAEMAKKITPLTWAETFMKFINKN
jgi:glycosyltransferase involved in cell wall biosynthesis